MKYLEIKEGKGYYLSREGIFVYIDKISKDDLLFLLDRAIEDEFTMDEYSAEILLNPAQSIIYQHIYSKMQELLKNKRRFIDESTQLYKEAIEKYRVMLD